MKNQINNTEIWSGDAHLEQDPIFMETLQREFSDAPALANDAAMNVGASRRDFLKYLGFSVGAATLAASCDIPVKRAMPYVVKPDTIVPGVATYYASSFVNGGDYCAVLVKTREGRPIKVEGNNLSSVTKGGTNARVQASVLSLYDTHRYQTPMKNEGGKLARTTWEDLDKEVASKLATGNVRVVTNTILSPTSKKALGEFLAKFPGATVVTYDPVSSSAILQANEQCFGKKEIPNYMFDKASMIVSFGADFLGTWISPVEYSRQYAAGRRVESVKDAKMSRHIQVESGMSLTGSNADHRILVRPSEMGAAIATLHNAVAAKTGGLAVSAPKVNEKAAAALTKLADQLAANAGKCLVVSGSNNSGEQVLVNTINNLLDSWGNTMTFANASLQRQGIDAEIQGLIKEMGAGSVGTVIVWGANPAFDLPNSAAFVEAFAKVKTKISFSGTPNETTALCDYIAPNHHWLESWGDAEPKLGHFSLMQPTITPLFKTRQAEETLLRWAGSTNFNPNAEQPYYEYLNANWQANMFTRQNSYATFQGFWDQVLHDGVFEVPTEAFPEFDWNGDVNAAAGKITKPKADGLEIALFETVNIGGGQYADNPWLQEMPDPVTRCVWENYLQIPIEFDGNRRFDGVGPFKGFNGKESYKEADTVKLTVNGQEQQLTCVRQFGQKKDCVSLALGYGRKVSGAAGRNIGVNTFPWCSIDADGNTQYFATVDKVSENLGATKFVSVQYHHTMGVTGKAEGHEGNVNVDEIALMTVGKGFQGSLVNRSVIERSNLSNLAKFMDNDKPAEGERQGLHQRRAHHEHLNQKSLYPYDQFVAEKYSQGHHWGLHIDLNACTGCGACQVACVAENNVPVVGKNEVFRHHEMTWMRIDRYYFGDYENPNVVYQPMMCQHCDNAPCENVCPVSATNHSSEGLNQMAYNRCIGTRYCANNCPYKVRRFNWMDYTTADLFPANEWGPEPFVPYDGEVPFYGDNLTRMVLNPDVTVRVRGVMEKCSFCVQRIQEGKLTAKKEGRALRDGDVKSACQTACPTGAITFGDTNDENSEIAKRYKSEMNYIVLEEVNVRPSVQYTVKVTNKDEALLS